jgi:hypothetical protein
VTTKPKGRQPTEHTLKLAAEACERLDEEEVRRARAVEPPAAGHRLQQERLAARHCIQAATALTVALRERDMARVRACIAVLEEANRACEAVGS